MKKSLFIISLIYFFGCSDKNADYPWSNLSFEEALSLKNDKIIFLDFYSDT